MGIGRVLREEQYHLISLELSEHTLESKSVYIIWNIRIYKCRLCTHTRPH